MLIYQFYLPYTIFGTVLREKAWSIDTVQPPSWEGVRGIYKKLSEEFHVLTKAYNINIDAQTKLHLDHLIVVIDEVDYCIDELPKHAQRVSVTDSLLEYLSNNQENWEHNGVPYTLAAKIKNIKKIVNHERIQLEFIGAARAIFYNTEAKRHTKDHNELIEYILKEGEATAGLPLSILKLSAKEPFGQFFTKLCMIMGLADLIIDAREDYKTGCIAFRPTFKLYCKLIYLVTKEGANLLWHFPRKFSFLLYCIRFTFALIKGG